MRAVLNGHFRVVVGQLLNREGLQADDDGPESWLEIVTALSLEAASVVKPDKSVGGGMDPGGYVKVKSVATGRRTESRVVRGIVCEKNIPHKRMTTRFKAPRLLLLGGSLEFQMVPNHLSSLETLLQQETDHLSMAISRIEAHQPNVLLVETAVTRQAQELLLARGISLVLNVKRSLLEQIARCTGATIVSSLEHLASAKVGHCELFYVEKYHEEHGCAEHGGKKIPKTLMFFEGCPKPVGCSILLKGADAEELKKVKHAVKLAVFAAYHLALETSFLADEGVDLPELCLKSPLSVTLPDKKSKSDMSISTVSGFSFQAKNQAQNSVVSLENSSISSAHSDLTTDNGTLCLREASPKPSVSLSGISSLVSSRANSPSSSPFSGVKDPHDGDSVRPAGTGSRIQEVIGATLGKLSAAVALDDFGQGVIGFTTSVKEALSAGKASEPSLKTKQSADSEHVKEALSAAKAPESSPATNQSADSEHVSMGRSVGLSLSTDAENQVLSVPSVGKDVDSVALEVPVSSQISNGDDDAQDPSQEDFPPSPSNHQSILVSFSSSCLRKGTICDRGHLYRIRYYGTFDKPLGRFLRETLFDLTFRCPACGEPKDAHVDCYTHRQGSLTISVHKQSQALAGENEGKIWMWHRCLKCPRVHGIPPASRRLVMSDAAWGLSFGKFLELSFSNLSAASRVASCGHSLHRDCLRFYGFGKMVACLRYSTVNVYSVCLPPSKLEFHCFEHQEWLQQEIREIAAKGDQLFKDIYNRLQHVHDKITNNGDGKSQEAKSYIMELKDILTKQKDSFQRALHDAASCRGADQPHADILQLNFIRRSLSNCSSLWDNRLHSLSSSLKSPRSFPGFDSGLIGDSLLSFLKEISFGRGRDRKSDASREPSIAGSPKSDSSKLNLSEGTGSFLVENSKPTEGLASAISVDAGTQGSDSESPGLISVPDDRLYSNRSLSTGNSSRTAKGTSVFNNVNNLGGIDRSLSEGHFAAFRDVSATIDAAWTGEGQTQDDFGSDLASAEKDAVTSEATAVAGTPMNEGSKRASSETSDEGSTEHQTQTVNPFTDLCLTSTLTSPAKAGQPSDIEGWVGAPYLSFSRPYNENAGTSFSGSAVKADAQSLSTLPVVPCTEQAGVQEGVNVSLSTSIDEPVVSVYDDEPTTVIAFAITSPEHQIHLFDKSEKDYRKKDQERNSYPFRAVDERLEHGDSKESNSTSSHDSLPEDPMLDSKAFHVKFNFTDDAPQGKIRYAVTCYYAKQFDCLRKRCCQNELDFIRSLCRCKKWGAQGGKSNVFFAKTADDRFVIKQVTRTELDSFITFAPAYFKYISEALITGSPTCLAKILGIYQVTVKHVKGGKELRMDLMIMENLLYGRQVTRVYDLKGSLRSRYNADATAKDAVLLDQNLLESLQTNPIFISNKAKRLLERAVWNDTAFLASVDVMDYSLLVGVDEQRRDLVLGIIDFMRQYTWDKHLETWVKASGILGGPKNAPPTVISPLQYKKRFRKAMSTYFLMVPDQWSPMTVISSLPQCDDDDDSFSTTLGNQSSLDSDTARV
eukprot:c23003_g1_i1 orf=182-4825(-)